MTSPKLGNTIMSRSAITQLRPLPLLPRCGLPESHAIVSDARQEKTRHVDFYSFDRDYIQKLTEGDAAVEQHFADYFGTLLLVKLRFRLQSDQEAEDLRQEVFLRVLRALRQGAGVQHAERFGAFVNSVCNNLVLEHFRQKRRMPQFDEDMPEPRDPRVDSEGELVSEESRQRVRTLIAELPPKDRNILKAVFLEERDKDEVCRELGVDRDYLRVLLHRARNRFRRLLVGRKSASTSS